VNPNLSNPVSATVPNAKLNAAIAGNGSFGNVCAGDEADLTLNLINQGQCNLNITSISVGGNYQVSSVALPLIMSHDASFSLPIRFTPTGVCSDSNPQTSVVTVNSNDPGGPYNQPVSGFEGCPKIVLSPTNLTGTFMFPPTVTDTTGVLGCYTDRTITVSNAGTCPLKITSLTTTGSNSFTVINPTTPVTIGPGAGGVPITVRFKPISLTGQLPNAPDQQTGVLNIVSNDPVGPSANLCGEPTERSGIRVLVTDGVMAPINPLAKLSLSSNGLSPQFSEKLTNLVPVSTALCGNPPGSIVYHLDDETLPPAGTTGSNPKASYTLTAQNGSKPISTSFTLGQCEFKVFTLQYK
jgi:hypothetical protein